MHLTWTMTITQEMLVKFIIKLRYTHSKKYFRMILIIEESDNKNNIIYFTNLLEHW